MAEAAPVQNITMPTIEPIFKCPKCNKYNMCLRTKKDNKGFFLTCLGKPECSHAIWLADVIKEFKVHDDECNKCRNGNKNVVIKFKTNNMLAMLNFSLVNENDRTYKSCILCDNGLRIILDINESNLRGNQNATLNRGQTINRPIHAQNVQQTNSNTNSRQPNDRPTNNRPTNTRPSLPNPHPNTFQNPNANQSFRNAGNIKCSGCDQPAVK